MSTTPTTTETDPRVCPVEKAGGLDNAIRKWLQNPNKILSPYIKPGMTVLDLGCGPGVFTVAIAELLAGQGKVIAADLQEGMLEKVRQKIRETALEPHIELHQCQADSIDLREPVDFALAFYMVHEVPDQEKLFAELKSIVKRGGMLFIVEPKIHVSKKDFEEMLGRLARIGFESIERPKVFFSRSVVLRSR